MEDSDNIMQILKSIKPIQYTYSKRQKALDKSFRSRSLQNLMKHLDYHHKFVDEFSPSPEFLKSENKYEINFKKSNAYIKELSDINKLPLISNNKNLEKKAKREEEKRKKEQLFERYKRLNFFKKRKPNIDSLTYNPNYDYIRKKVFVVHIKPPPPLETIKEKNKENEKYINKKKKSSSKDKNQDENSIINKTAFEKEQNKNISDITLDKNKKQNNSIEFNTNNQNVNINNSSTINNESYSNRSNSSKNHNIFSSNQKNSSIISLLTKKKLINLKSFSKKNYENRYSLSNSCCTMEVNKSTNIEDISNIYHDKEKIHNLNSMRNISNKNMKLPKIKNIKGSALNKKFKENDKLKYFISFKKMIGRDDNKSNEKKDHLIVYNPNYEFFRPHIHSTFFTIEKNDENYKKYKTGKIIRGYSYSPDQYFVCEFKKKEPAKFNINRERLKILEMWRKKIE